MIQIGPNYTSTLTISSNVSVGTLDVSGNPTTPSISVSTGFTLTVTQGTLRGGSIAGLGTLTVQDAPAASFTVNGASTVSVAALTVGPQASLNIQADTDFNTTTITQSGAMNWTGGDMTLAMGAVLTNTGTFTIATNNTLSGGEPSPTTPVGRSSGRAGWHGDHRDALQQ